MKPSAPVYVVRNANPEDWSQAQLLQNFSYPWLARSAPRTHFRALIWKERFHFLFDVDNANHVLSNAEDEVTRVLDSDRVEIFFAADAELRSYFCLELDPRGNVHDYSAEFYRRFNNNWRWPGLQVEAALFESQYRVSGSLPIASLAALKLFDVSDHTVLAGVYRADFSLNESGQIQRNWISWVDPGTKAPDFHVPSSFGKFQLELSP